MEITKKEEDRIERLKTKFNQDLGDIHLNYFSDISKIIALLLAIIISVGAWNISYKTGLKKWIDFKIIFLVLETLVLFVFINIIVLLSDNRINSTNRLRLTFWQESLPFEDRQTLAKVLKYKLYFKNEYMFKLLSYTNLKNEYLSDKEKDNNIRKAIEFISIHQNFNNNQYDFNTFNNYYAQLKRLKFSYSSIKSLEKTVASKIKR